MVGVREWPHGADLAASPDCKWLTFFTELPFQELQLDWQPNVIDLTKGAIQPVGAPVRYYPPPSSSYAAPAPPSAWLGETTLLFVRTDVKVQRATEDRVEYAGDPVNWVAAADMTTRELRDVVAIPGSAWTTELHLLPRVQKRRCRRSGASSSTLSTPSLGGPTRERASPTI